ncbi:MAG: GAF domain-containing sensor histidine kinase [Acidobacteria bacterium]|nr:GAF domain-containing sensor histidine kinase [Acidobacteriota bacterium]
MDARETTTLRLVSGAAVEGQPEPFTAGEQQVLDTINRRIAATDSLEALLEFLFDAVQKVLTCDRIGVAFVEEDGVRLVAHTARASYEPLLLRKGYAEDLAGSSLERVLHSGAPRIIEDLEQYLRERPHSASTRLLIAEGVRSSMTCPLFVDARIVGLLFFSSRRPRAYGDRDVRFHLAIAERLSQAVDKARRIEQLAEATRAYSEMLGFVSHELKSPLASIVTDAAVLTGGFRGALNDQQGEAIAKMTRKAEYLLNLVREYLDLARVEGGELQARPRDGVDFTAEIVDPACDIVAPQLVERRMTLERVLPAGPVVVSCDPDLLKIVAVNLLSNAVKYGREQGRIRLTVEGHAAGFGLRVWNEGPGFPASQRPRLFRRFSRLDTPELRKRKGTGVGLYTSWRIVKLHGGTLSADSREGEWAEFRCEIPQPIPGATAPEAREPNPGRG